MIAPAFLNYILSVELIEKFKGDNSIKDFVFSLFFYKIIIIWEKVPHYTTDVRFVNNIYQVFKTGAWRGFNNEGEFISMPAFQNFILFRN